MSAVLPSLHARRALLALLLVAGAACDRPTRPEARAGVSALRLFALVPSGATTRLAVEVTAPDLAVPLLFNLDVADGVASGTLTLPAGSNRTLTVRAFAGAVETHRGSVTLTVRETGNAPVSVTLQPLSGDVPITAAIGGVLVAVAPVEVRLSVGETAQLVATARDERGVAFDGPVTWASLNPGRADVDADGVVTARDTGAVTIVASVRGVGGASVVRIQPAGDFSRLVLQRADSGLNPSWVRSIWGSGPSDVWVGAERGLMRWNGTAWRRVTPAGDAGNRGYKSLWGRSAAEVYGITWGTERPARWDGATWSFMAAPPDGAVRFMNDIWASAPNDVFVAADAGKLLHWNGAAWATQSTGAAYEVLTVWGAAANDVYAGGWVDCAGAAGCRSLFHYDGTAWTPVVLPTVAPIRAIGGTGPSDVWAVGGGEAFHFDGSRWSRTTFRSGVEDLSSVWPVGPSEVYASSENGDVVRYDGAGWTRELRAPGEHVAAVWASGPGDAFAAGWPGAVYRRVGGAWRTEVASGGAVRGLWGFGGADIFAVDSRDGILHWDGATWSREPAATGVALHDLWGASRTGLFVVGAAGTILRGTTGAWTRASGIPDVTLRGVHGSGPSDVWAVGDGGTILHFDGAAWTRSASGTTATLQDVWAVSPSLAYAVGDQGTVLQYDGRGWRRAAPDGGFPTFANGRSLQGVYATADAAFVVGQGGVIYRYDGARWLDESNGSAQFVEIFGRSANDVVAIGWNNAVWRFDGARWRQAFWFGSTGAVPRTYSSIWMPAASTFVAGGSYGLIVRVQP